MLLNYVNLSGTGTETLSAALTDGSTKTITRLLICNRDSTAITASLWLQNAGGDIYYIIRNVEIESGYTLDVLDGDPLVYNDTYNLNASLGHSDYIADVIINETRTH